MRIINRTHWRTDHLRAFVARVAEDELDPAKRRTAVITFVYTRGGTYSSGHATLGGSRATVRLSSGFPSVTRLEALDPTSQRIRPQPMAAPRPPDKVDLAGVLAHEMAHLRGMTHAQMRGSVRYRRGPEHRTLYRWAEALPLERKPTRVVPPAVRQERALLHAEAKVAEWTRTARLAQGWAKRWAKRAAILRRRLAAAPAPPAASVQKDRGERE